jgi:hypothetical protein
METKGFIGEVWGKVKSFLTGKKSDTFDDISLVESYDTEPFEIENVESYYKLITKISAIPKSLQEIYQTIISQKYTIVDTSRENKEVKNIPPQLQALFDNPHEQYTLSELITLLIIDLLIAGCELGYLVQEGKKLTVRRIDPQYLQYIRGQWYENNPYGKIMLLDPKYFIHVKYQPDPYNPRWGKGIIANNIALFTRIIRMLEFSENFYENGCHPTGLFSIENGGAVDQKRVEAIVKAKKGTKNAGDPLVLTGKVTYQQIQLDPSVLKLSEELTILYKEVMAAFGLPRFLMEVGLRDAGQKYNNHALQMEYFLKSTIMPVANRVEEFFSNIVRRFNPNWAFKFDISGEVYDPADLQALVQDGVINRSEHRKLLNLPESKNKELETHLIPSTYKTLEQVIEGVDEYPDMNDLEPPTPPTVPSKEPKLPASPKKSIANGREREKSWRDDHYLSEPAEKVWTVEEIKKATNQKRIRQDFINLNAKTRAKKSKEAAVKLNLHLIDIYGEIIANVAKLHKEIEALSKPEKGEKSNIGDLINDIYDEKENLSKMEKITNPLFQGVGEATFATTAAILTTAIAFVPTAPGIASKLNLLRKDGPLVTQVTKGKLTETIIAGIEVGKTHNEIAKDIWLRFVDENNDLADEFSKIYRVGVKPKDFDAVMARGGKLQSRATLIARTEVARANRLFAAESMSQSQVVKTVTIINCEPGCPICGPHQNVEVSFADADTIGNLHPNCSGTLVPGTIEVN